MGAQLGLQKHLVMFTKKLWGVFSKTLGVLSRNSGSLGLKLWEFYPQTLGVFFANITAKILEITEPFCFFA
jgi:hypothetical protein